MIHELKSPASLCVRQLFRPLDFHASCAAVLNGDCPGRVLVDDPQQPASGFVLSPEAAYLAGDAEKSDFCSRLETFLQEDLGFPLRYLVFIVTGDGWVVRLEELGNGVGVVSRQRRHYLSKPEKNLVAVTAPPGADLRRIDEAFLGDAAQAKPEHLLIWIRNNWGSQDHFLQAGFGVCAVCAGEVVAWSIADCVTDGRCEIGIRTIPGWRRRGMGSFTAHGAIRLAYSLGHRAVGWHCHEENIGSRRTALRAGFVLERVYTEYALREPFHRANG